MYFLVDDHGERLGKYQTREEAVEALGHLVAADAPSADECAVIELDAQGTCVGAITHGNALSDRSAAPSAGYDTDRIRRQVMSSDEADAVAEVVEAGRALARTWFAVGFWGKPHVPDAIALREALQRLGEDRV